jgi:hypothetical protein
MEDYSACGLTPSGPASLRSTVRLRSRSARRTWWRFSSSIWSFSPKKGKTTEVGFSMLAGDGGLFGLRPHPFGASVATLHCSASLTLSASNLVEILILHLELFPEKRKTHRSGLFHVGWGWRIRTSTYGVRVRCPAIRRIPNRLIRISEYSPGHLAGEKRLTLGVLRTLTGLVQADFLALNCTRVTSQQTRLAHGTLQ